jgi:hypothetical protein
VHIGFCFGVAGLLALALAGCNEIADKRAAADPKTSPPTEIGKRIESLPDYAHFAFSGVAFYGGRLYVTTNIGLIELQGTTLTSLHTWYSNDDVVEGPWVDKTSNSLWIQRAHDGALLRLDGTGWHLIALPTPPKGYYSRGDVLEGFRGASDTSGFRLNGGGYVWVWNPPDHWILETSPSVPESSTPVGVGFSHGREIQVMRLGTCLSPMRPCNYAFYSRDGDGWSAGRNLPVWQVRQVLGTGDGVFARSEKGELVRLDDNGAVVLETPGKCEAIAVTSAGKLMASFVGAGVFTLTQEGWTKALDYPYGSSEGEHWADLAEETGVVAYATSSMTIYFSGGKREYSGSTALWVSEGGKWIRIDTENAVTR